MAVILNNNNNNIMWGNDSLASVLYMLTLTNAPNWIQRTMAPRISFTSAFWALLLQLHSSVGKKLKWQSTYQACVEPFIRYQAPCGSPTTSVPNSLYFCPHHSTTCSSGREFLRVALPFSNPRPLSVVL